MWVPYAIWFNGMNIYETYDCTYRTHKSRSFYGEDKTDSYIYSMFWCRSKFLLVKQFIFVACTVKLTKLIKMKKKVRYCNRVNGWKATLCFYNLLTQTKSIQYVYDVFILTVTGVLQLKPDPKKPFVCGIWPVRNTRTIIMCVGCITMSTCN